MVIRFSCWNAAAGAEHVARVVRQVLGEGVLGLLGEGDAVDQEQDAGDLRWPRTGA